MGATSSQITSLTIVYSTVHSGADQRKHQSSVSLAFCAGNSSVTGEFPAQMASNAENIWDDEIMREHDLSSSYLHNRISYTGKKASLYLITPGRVSHQMGLTT